MTTTKFEITLKIEAVNIDGISVGESVISNAITSAVEKIQAGIHENVVKVIEINVSRTGATGIVPRVVRKR